MNKVISELIQTIDKDKALAKALKTYSRHFIKTYSARLQLYPLLEKYPIFERDVLCRAQNDKACHLKYVQLSILDLAVAYVKNKQKYSNGISIGKGYVVADVFRLSPQDYQNYAIKLERR